MASRGGRREEGEEREGGRAEMSQGTTRTVAHWAHLLRGVCRQSSSEQLKKREAEEEEGEEGVRHGEGSVWAGASRRLATRAAAAACCCCLRPAFNTQFNTKFMGSVSDDMRRTRNRNWNCSWNSEIPEFGMCNRLSKWVSKASSALSRLGDSHTSLDPLQGAG